MVTMLRYSTTSASSHRRPRPGMTYVPPSSIFQRDGDAQDLVEGIEQALDGAAAIHANYGVQAGSEDVADCQHVGTAEVNDAVAVGQRVRNVSDDDGFAVEGEILRRSEVFVVGPERFGHLELRAGRTAEKIEHVGLRDDARLTPRGSPVQTGQCDIAVDVVRIGVGVDDPLHWLCRLSFFSAAAMFGAPMASVPVSTTTIPSSPTCAAMLPAEVTSM